MGSSTWLGSSEPGFGVGVWKAETVGKPMDKTQETNQIKSLNLKITKPDHASLFPIDCI